MLHYPQRTHGAGQGGQEGRVCRLPPVCCFNVLLFWSLERSRFIISRCPPSPSPPPQTPFSLLTSPVGCGVFSLKSFLESSDSNEEQDTEMKIEVMKPNEEEQFCSLHELIIKGQNGKFTSLDRSKCVYIRLRVLQGDLAQAKKENPLLFKKTTGNFRNDSSGGLHQRCY